MNQMPSDSDYHRISPARLVWADSFFAVSRKIVRFAVGLLAFGLTTPANSWAQDIFGDSAVVPPSPQLQGDRPVSEDPVVESVRQSNPTTAAELGRAVRIMMDLDKDKLAAEYLEKLAAVETDDQAKFEFHQTMGSDFLFTLFARESLYPLNRKFVTDVMAGSNRYVNDPARLEALTNQLTDPDIYQRTEALEQLRYSGASGAATLLNAIADPAREDDARMLGSALSHFGPTATEPVLGATRSSNQRVRFYAINAAKELLGQPALEAVIEPLYSDKSSDAIRGIAKKSIAKIAGKVPARETAASLLKRASEDFLFDRRRIVGDLDGRTTLWRENPNTGRLEPLGVDIETAARIFAADRAEDLVAIAPTPENRRHHLLCLIEAGKLLRGMDRPLDSGPAFQLAQELGVREIELVLARALEFKRTPTVVGACELLGRLGDAQLLASRNGPSPLVRAVQYGDLRAQFAATEAIMNFDPTSPFPGCSYVAESIVSLARTGGQASIVIGHHHPDKGQTMASILNDNGYPASTAATGRELFKLASQPNVEYLVISDTLAHPSYRELIHQLRKSPRTRRLPIALMYRSERIEHSSSSGAAKIEIPVILVLDTRGWPDYDDYIRDLRRHSEAKNVRIVLLADRVDSNTAVGVANFDPFTKVLPVDSFFQIEHSLGRLQEFWKTAREPLALVVSRQPNQENPNSDPDTELKLVINASKWNQTSDWVRGFRFDSRTKAISISIVRGRDAELIPGDLPGTLTGLGLSAPTVGDVDKYYLDVLNVLNRDFGPNRVEYDQTHARRARRLQKEDPLLVAMPWTLNANLISRQINRLVSLSSDRVVSMHERFNYANQAMGWLSDLVQSEKQQFFNFYQFEKEIAETIHFPELGETAAGVLGHMASPRAQRELISVASQSGLPLGLRDSAAIAFRAAVDRRGILLNTSEIQQQYNRYNASEGESPETQKVLGAILDAIESRVKKK